MVSRLKRLVSRPVGCAALAMTALVSGCGGDPLASDRVFCWQCLFGQPSQADPIHGIDVSKFQGNIDWNAVASSGVKFAWIKATEGGDRDARFQANWEGAKAAGIPHGAYHFVYWCRPPLEEIHIFEQNAPVDPDALPPVLDVEATPTSPTCHRHLNPRRRHRRHAGHAAGDGAPLRQAADHLHDHRFLRGGPFRRRVGGLSDLGALDQTPSRREVRRLNQSDGRVPGIGGKVDKDAFYGTKEQWDAFLREPGVRPAQTGAAGPASLRPRKRLRCRLAHIAPNLGPVSCKGLCADEHTRMLAGS